jgi:hypothetical protein
MKSITSVILVKKIARSCSTLGNSIEIESSPNSRNSNRTDWRMVHRGLSSAVTDVRSREVDLPHPDHNSQRERNGTGHDGTQADGAGSWPPRVLACDVMALRGTDLGHCVALRFGCAGSVGQGN